MRKLTICFMFLFFMIYSKPIFAEYYYIESGNYNCDVFDQPSIKEMIDTSCVKIFNDFGAKDFRINCSFKKNSLPPENLQKLASLFNILENSDFFYSANDCTESSNLKISKIESYQEFNFHKLEERTFPYTAKLKIDSNRTKLMKDSINGNIIHWILVKKANEYSLDSATLILDNPQRMSKFNTKLENILRQKKEIKGKFLVKKKGDIVIFYPVELEGI